MPLFSITGLASGIDTQKLVAELMAIERRPVVLLRGRRTTLENVRDAWSDVKSKLATFQSKLGELKPDSTWKAKTAASSNTAVLTATASSSAQSGIYTIRVSKIAQAHRVSGTAQAAGSSTALWLDGTFTINGVSVSVVTSDTLAGIRDKINAAGAGVTASIYDNTLVIQANNTGAASAISFTDSTAGAAKVTYSSNASLLTATAASSAAQADHSIAVSQLASDHKVQSAVVADPNADRLKSGTLSLTVNGVTRNYTISGTDSVNDLITLINSDASRVVDASLSADDRLVFTSRTNGAAGSITVSDTSGFLDDIGMTSGGSTWLDVVSAARDASFTVNGTAYTRATNTVSDVIAGVTLSLVGANASETVTLRVRYDGVLKGIGILTDADAIRNTLVPAQDAEFTVDGFQYTRASNTVTDALAGVTLRLIKADPASDVTLTIAGDVGAITGKVQAMVDAYNSALGAINAYVKKGGTLQGDPTLTRLQDQLRRTMSGKADGAGSTSYDELVDAGIQSGDNAGTLTFDRTTFEKQFNDDAAALQALFFNSSDAVTGVGEKLDALADNWVKSTGFIPGRTRSLDDRIEDIKDQIERWEVRLALREKTLLRQFTAMEQALAQLQVQGQAMSIRFAQLLGTSPRA